MEERINEILQQMSLEEKAALLAGADLWHSVPNQRLGIPVLKVSDGPVGARGANGSSGPTSACFPCGTALAATWNVDLVQQVGEALADETKAKGAHILLAPTVNIHRSPLAGRNFECYSEDPYLTGRMATAYILGLQSKGVGACIKHFVGNDSEFERNSISSEIEERPLNEIYLTPFRMALRDAKPWSVMSSYNRLNGTYCSESPRLLKDILKGKWGFDGIVISDWLGSYSPGVTAGGLDLEMPGPGRWLAAEAVIKQVQSGEVDETEVDDKVRRFLRTLFRVGAFHEPLLQAERANDLPEHRTIARQAAAEAIVLLKNEGEALPLTPDKVHSIAIIGENARWAQIRGGGSADVTPYYVVSPETGIREAAGSAIQVEFALGTSIHRSFPLLDPAWLQNAEGKHGFDIAFYNDLDLSGQPSGHWFSDRTSISWSDEYIKGVNPHQFAARLSACLAVPESGNYSLSLAGNGKYRLFLDEKQIINLWPEQSVDDAPWDHGASIAKIELQSGQSYDLRIDYVWQGNIPWRELRIGCEVPLELDSIDQAAALARRCDVAIVVAGLTNEWESEGFDRVDMDLPREQNELITRVAKANPRTIVVLNVGSPVRMPWLDQVAGVLQVWYPGQEAGHALADVLFGHVNPCGKLPTTFPVRLEDNPAYINYPGENGRVVYGEGLFVGYRYYDKKDVAPLFPFGFGLSYTSFEYRNLKLSKDTYHQGEPIEVSLEVVNTGKRSGKEIVQLYLHDVQSSLVRPPKELKAFVKVALQPGETRTVTFSLNEEALAFYDDKAQAWISEPGEFEVLVGASSHDIRLVGHFSWQCFVAGGRFSISTPLRQLLDDPQAKEVLSKHIGPMLDHPMLEMAKDMSLEQIAPFAPDYLTPELRQTIDEELGCIE